MNTRVVTLVYLPSRPLSLGPFSLSIALRLYGIPCANSSFLFSFSMLLGFVHFIQCKSVAKSDSISMYITRTLAKENLSLQEHVE